MRDTEAFFRDWQLPYTDVTDAEHAYYGPGVFVKIIRERAVLRNQRLSAEFIKNKVTRLMKYERDCQVLRGTVSHRKPRPVTETDKNWLQYTLDPDCMDETEEGKKEELSPIGLLLFLIRKNFETHTLIDSRAIKDKWETLRKAPAETHEHFFLCYEN